MDMVCEGREEWVLVRDKQLVEACLINSHLCNMAYSPWPAECHERSNYDLKSHKS